MSERQVLMPLMEYPWTRWFAWHPVKLETDRWVWLRRIEKRRVWFIHMFTEYRALEVERMKAEVERLRAEKHP